MSNPNYKKGTGITMRIPYSLVVEREDRRNQSRMERKKLRAQGVPEGKIPYRNRMVNPTKIEEAS